MPVRTGFPDVLLQEIRALLALDARNHVITQKGSLKTDNQLIAIEKIFSGSDGFASVVDAMIDQKGFYAHMFDKIPLEVNRQGNEYRTHGVMYELKPMLHLQSGELKCERCDDE